MFENSNFANMDELLCMRRLLLLLLFFIPEIKIFIFISFIIIMNTKTGREL